MRSFALIPMIVAASLFFSSCGVNGDPGHCYFSLDLEYYNEDFGVFSYEDTNPDVPDMPNIQRNFFYDCYPGEYDFYYESEDYDYRYRYEGFYKLVQNPGTPSRMFTDGIDGEDTFFELKLLVYGKKGFSPSGSAEIEILPGEILSDQESKQSVITEKQCWEQSHNGWTLKVEQTVKRKRKSDVDL